MVFKAFWPWIPCSHRACSILEPASVLCRGLSAAFRVICNILSRVSVWIYFRLVRVYLGDQRMRRVKDQDEEGKGPGDQEDPGTQGTKGPGHQGTRGPRDQGTRGREDHGTKGPGDQRTRGPEDQGTKGGHATLLYVFFALPRRPHATSLYVLLRFERYIMLQHM